MPAAGRRRWPGSHNRRRRAGAARIRGDALGAWTASPASHRGPCSPGRGATETGSETTKRRRPEPRTWSGPSFRLLEAGGGYEIRTREGLPPTRFPSVRPRPLGESSADHFTGHAGVLRTVSSMAGAVTGVAVSGGRVWGGGVLRGPLCPIDSKQTPRAASPYEPPQGRKAARISKLWRVRGGSFCFPWSGVSRLLLSRVPSDPARGVTVTRFNGGRGRAEGEVNAP